MKLYDVIRIVKDAPYKQFNIKKEDRGIVIDRNESEVKALFFNDKNLGEYAIISLCVNDAVVETHSLPSEYVEQLKSNLPRFLKKAKNKIENPKFNEYDYVELISNDYSNFGVSNGETGSVVDAVTINGKIMVDFSGINENGDVYGDCILFDVNDLKKFTKKDG